MRQGGCQPEPGLQVSENVRIMTVAAKKQGGAGVARNSFHSRQPPTRNNPFHSHIYSPFSNPHTSLLLPVPIQSSPKLTKMSQSSLPSLQLTQKQKIQLAIDFLNSNPCWEACRERIIEVSLNEDIKSKGRRSRATYVQKTTLFAPRPHQAAGVRNLRPAPDAIWRRPRRFARL
jgi:hypothetical protein